MSQGQNSAPGARTPVIALLTDFGIDDWYVGTMKGVIKSICPAADIVDVSHAVSAQSVMEGSIMLGGARKFFPPGTIFVAVVDPGVGTSREAVVVRAAGQFIVAPNNGLITGALQRDEKCECRRLCNEAFHLPERAGTFDGRDVFAPCAAHIAAGVPWEEVAPETTKLLGLPVSMASSDSGILDGNIIYFDHFGNAITNIPKQLFEMEPPDRRKQERPAVAEQIGLAQSGAGYGVYIGQRLVASLVNTYGDVETGRPLAYWGSLGNLEIAVNRGNARSLLDLKLMDKVIMRRLDQQNG